MHVAVTAEHIAKGVRQTMAYCPVALAIKEVVAGREVDVMPLHAYIGWGDATEVCDLPEVTYDFIVAFDAGHDVTPFEFDTECRPLYTKGQEGR